jgi:hypothetical protein
MQPGSEHFSDARPRAAMRVVAFMLLVMGAIGGCSSERGDHRGNTTQMFPDCDQISAEQQRHGRCMRRPDMPDGL